MINRNNKKGFTIVELVIVIAVIAILAAVLIPTFAGIIRKANISADTQLVKNMNTALAADEAINGKPEDFNDVIAIVREAGYVLSCFNPTTEGCYVAWEKETNQLLLIDGKDNFEVIYSAKEGYGDPDDSWYFSVSSQEAKETLIEKYPTGVNVWYTISEAKNLADVLASGEDTISISLDESLVVGNDDRIAINNANADVTLNLGDSSVSSAVLESVPFEISEGTLNVIGGTVTALGKFVDSDGITQESAFLGLERGVLNIDGTTITSTTTQPLYFRGSDGAAKNATVTGKNAVLSVRTAEVTITNCNVTATGDRAIWVTSTQGTNPDFVGDAVVTIDGGTYTAANKVIGAWDPENDKFSTTINVKNGTFKATDANGKVFSFYGATAAGATFVITGGTFNDTAFAKVTDWAALCDAPAGYTVNVEGAGTSTVTITAVKN